MKLRTKSIQTTETKSKSAVKLKLNQDATLLFRYKLAETQKLLQSQGIISQSST